MGDQKNLMYQINVLRCRHAGISKTYLRQTLNLLCWSVFYEAHESSCLHQQLGISAMRYFIIKVRMQLGDLLLELLTSLCASEYSERFTFHHPRVGSFLFPQTGCELCSREDTCLLRSHNVLKMQSKWLIIENATPLKMLEQENTFEDQLKLNCMVGQLHTYQPPIFNTVIYNTIVLCLCR